jgi:hypothetical protein
LAAGLVVCWPFVAGLARLLSAGSFNLGSLLAPCSSAAASVGQEGGSMLRVSVSRVSCCALRPDSRDGAFVPFPPSSVGHVWSQGSGWFRGLTFWWPVDI